LQLTLRRENPRKSAFSAQSALQLTLQRENPRSSALSASPALQLTPRRENPRKFAFFRVIRVAINSTYDQATPSHNTPSNLLQKICNAPATAGKFS
jgi:hypothetical protein